MKIFVASLLLFCSVASLPLYAGTVTFKAEQSFTDEQIVGFAKFLGWQEKIWDKDGPTIGQRIDNPETAEEYVRRLFLKHVYQFTTSWAKSIKDSEFKKQVAPIDGQLEDSIVKPIKDGFKIVVEKES